MADLGTKISEVEIFHKKNLDNANKKLKKTLKEVNENLKKFAEGVKQLEKLEKEKMALGVEATAKKGKMHFKATKALGEMVKGFQKELVDYPTSIELKEAEYWVFEDFKIWLKGYNKFVNNLDDERRRANKIMGLDYMLKRRVAESPLNKLVEARDIFRDMLANEFQIIKIIEDLNRIKDEIEESDNKLVELKQKLSNLNKEQSSLLEKKETLEKEVEVLENQGEVKIYRDFKINFQSTELDIGHQINPLKKDFRVLSSKGSSLTTVGTFEVGVAKQYEDNTLETFHSDAENDFKMLKSLSEALIANADPLKIKANHVHRLKQLQQSIESGKLKQMHETTLDIISKMKELEKDPNLIENANIIENKRKIIDEKSNQLTKLEEDVEKTNSVIVDEEKAEEVKQERFSELRDESLRLELEKK
ncbi:MAG: hypothetical protein ACW967_01675 [Candidatus Hodarchaeales archaeon]|jgi:hypothetical protein